MQLESDLPHKSNGIISFYDKPCDWVDSFDFIKRLIGLPSDVAFDWSIVTFHSIFVTFIFFCFVSFYFPYASFLLFHFFIFSFIF